MSRIQKAELLNMLKSAGIKIVSGKYVKKSDAMKIVADGTFQDYECDFCEDTNWRDVDGHYETSGVTNYFRCDTCGAEYTMEFARISADPTSGPEFSWIEDNITTIKEKDKPKELENKPAGDYYTIDNKKTWKLAHGHGDFKDQMEDAFFNGKINKDTVMYKYTVQQAPAPKKIKNLRSK